MNMQTLQVCFIEHCVTHTQRKKIPESLKSNICVFKLDVLKVQTLINECLKAQGNHSEN